MTGLGRFRSLDVCLLICLLVFCLGTCCHALDHAHHGQHRHHHHGKRVDTAVAASSTMSLEAAQDQVQQALSVLSTVNKDLVANPQRNTYRFQNTSTIQNNTQAPPLQYRNTSIASRSLAMGQNHTNPYTIPVELAEAARIVAESTSNSGLGAQGLDVEAILSKYRPKINDTNVPPQAHRDSNGLGIAFVLESAGSGQSVLSPLSKRDSSSFWLTELDQTGESPFAPAGYKVWRNVMDYGAKGDGVTDDTVAINNAISDGGRCGQSCGSSTIYPAFVYFPPGTYLVSSPIIQYYNTEFYGDPLDYPTILAASSFVGLGVITSDVYTAATTEWYINTNNFLRTVRNFKMDVTRTDPNAYVCAIHWQVAQATSLENIIFYMMQDSTTTQQGIYMENGSGGFLTNLTFVGGNFGAFFGNQQFTTSQLSFLNCNTALQISWDWAWTMQDIIIDNCNQGIVIVGGAGGPMSTGQGVGALVLIDSTIVNTPTGIVTSLLADNSTAFLLQNTYFQNVTTAIIDNIKGDTLMAGGAEVSVDSWGFGRLALSSTNVTFVNGQDIPVMNRSSSLIGPDGYYKPNFYQRRRPAYTDIGMSQIVDVKAWGASGDGVTDDTAVLNSILDRAANMSSIVFFPFGVYIITDTLQIPIGSRIIGQAWSQIMATGPNFQDEKNPRVAVQVAQPGDQGIIEIQSMMFTVSGPTAGAILVEWNAHESIQGSVGMWDSHFRVGGAIGSHLQATVCPTNAGVNFDCRAASLLLHLTPQSSAYLENVWLWTADHDMDSPSQEQISVYSGRGMLIESQGPTWLYATASEHHALYQYQLLEAQDVYMGMIQTESPYYQPQPMAPAPFDAGLFPSDPAFGDCTSNFVSCAVSWALRIVNSQSIYSLGAGLYSWFSDYDQTCLQSENCQQSVVEIVQSNDTWLYNLVTKGTVEMVTPNGENATLAADNVNGFMSSILAWVRDDAGTIGASPFPGFQLYGVGQPAGVSSGCQTALGEIIYCAEYFPRMFTEPQVAKSTGNTTFTDYICDPSCGSSLQSWFQNVENNCANQTIGGAVPTILGGYIWQGYNQTCLKDPSTGDYCTDVLNSQTIVDSVDAMPRDEMCSYCYTHWLIMMQNSSFSAYNQLFQSNLEAVQANCGLTGPTDLPPPLYTPSPPAVSFCLSNETYTTQEGDTCDSIADQFSVASAAVLLGNSNTFNNCSNIPVGSSICLPLSCNSTYSLQPNDTDCMTIEADNGLFPGSLRSYNPWINFGCNNLQNASQNLGTVLCLSPQAGLYNGTNSSTNLAIFPTSSTGYSDLVVVPPANATIANGTTMYCGVWYTAAAGDTCAQICIQQSINWQLFTDVNPSLSLSNCDSSLVVNTTYCVQPHFAWNDPAFYASDSGDNSTSTPATPMSSTSIVSSLMTATATATTSF